MAGTEILIGLAISAATSLVTSALAPKQRLLPVDKGRFDDIRIQGSEYGSSIPIVYGRARLAGNVIYSDGVQPWVTTTPGRSGGKMGGGRPPEPPTNNYSYTTNIAIAVCEGIVNAGLKRMWENTKVTINTDTSPLSGQTWEAESTANTLTGGATIIRDLSASSGYKVQFIGTSSLMFSDIIIPQTGTYDIKISYATSGSKSALMKVDAGADEVVNFTSTGSSSVFASVSISKSLTQGTHTITFSNNGGNVAPYFDAIAVNGAGVVLTPTAVTGIVDPDADYPIDPNNPSDYYNARLVMDVYGTSEGRVNEMNAVPEPVDDIIPIDGGPIISPGGGVGTGTNTGSAGFRFYNGSETQQPDPMMIQIEGADKVPAYRGTAYISLTKYQIPDGQMPNFTFEVDEGTHDLADVVKALWKRVGLEDAQLDITALVGTYVEGLVIQSRTALSDILDTLQIAFAFDFVDVNGKITAVRRGSEPVVTILPNDLRAHDDGSEVPVAELEGTYVNVEELPRQIDVSYLDRAKDYHTNIQPAMMQIGYSEEPQTLVLPIVLSADQAHEIGMRVINTIHLQRVTFGFTLPPKYSYLSPSDVINVEMPTVTHKLRITQLQSGMPGMIKVQAVPDSASLYQQLPAGDAGSGQEVPPIQYPANTELALMDIPPLFPEHTGFGFYAAACGRGTGSWYGAHLYREEVVDSGNYERIGGFEVPATMGIVSNTLSTSPTYNDINPDVDIVWNIDTTTSITVNMFTGTLESFPQADLFANPALNLCCIGEELVQFATASAVTSSVNPYERAYTLTNFRRGMNGTTSKISGHTAGEKFVYINNAVKRMREQSALLYTSSRYKAVSVGQPLTGASVVTFSTGAGGTPPVAQNLNCVPSEIIAQDGTTQIVIRGTFNFGTFAGGQRAKVFIKRPTVVGGTSVESTFFNTGIIVAPDANNNGGFEIPAAVAGRYIIQVVTMTPFDWSALTGHPDSTVDVVAGATAPATPSTPTVSFDGQQVTWTWTQSTASNHSHYKVYSGAGAVIATRVDGNTFTEYPVNGMTRKITAVNRSGVESLFSGTATFTLTTPNPPTSYNVVFNGVELLHSWVDSAGSSAQYLYEIADGTPTVLGVSSSSQWIEHVPPSSRSFTRQIRAKLFGVTSSWVSTTVTIPAISAPQLVEFLSISATPFNIDVAITPPAGLNRRQVLKTVVEIVEAANTANILQTQYYDGVAELAPISGRFLNTINTIKVRAYYTDFIGNGSSAITATSHQFTSIGDDFGEGIINETHFASSIRPVQIYNVSTTVLPTLPDAAYPLGSQLYWVNAADITERKLWRNVDGSGATATATVVGGIITSVAVDTGGSGYTAPPSIRLSGGGGTGGALTAVITGGAVTSIIVNDGGTGYAAPPTLSISAWVKNVDAQDLTAQSITAGQISVGAIGADQISANAIRADKIAIGSFGNNLIANPSFESYNSNSAPIGWKIVEGSTSGVFTSSTDQRIEGGVSLKLNNGFNYAVGSILVPVTDAANYTIRLKIRSQASAGNYYVRVNEYNSQIDQTMKYIGSASSGDIVARSSYTDLTNVYLGLSESLSNRVLSSLNGLGWVQKESVYLVPSGVKYITLSVYTTGANDAVYVDDIVVQKRVSGVFIENGTITAENLVIGGMTDNLLANPSFETPSNAGNFAASWSWHVADVVTRQQHGTTGSYYAQMTAGGGITSRMIAVSPGQRIAVRFRAWAAVNGNTLNVHPTFVQNRNADKEFIGSTNTLCQTYDGGEGSGYLGLREPRSSYSAGNTFTLPLTLSTTSTIYEGIIEVPSNRYWMSFSTNAVTGTSYIDDIEVRKQVGQAFISDLRAEQITANTIGAGLIFADQIKQANFTPYQSGSSYTPDLGYDYAYASGGTYDLITNTINIVTSTVNDNTNSVVTTTWQKINSATDGYVEFTAPAELNSTKSFVVGLTANWNPASYVANSSHFAVDYAWYFSGATTTAYIREADANQFTVGALLAGDVLRVGIENDYVRFRKNGILIWTSPYKPSAGTIRHGTRNSVTLNTQNANYRGVFIGAGDGTARTISFVAPKIVQEGSGQGWKLNPLTGTALFADEPHWDTNYDTGTISSSLQVGRMVQKSSGGASAWDTSVVTSQQILSGDGWFETTVRSLSTLSSSIFGLSSNNDWASPNYNPHVTYGLNFVSSSSVQVWENGVYTGTAIAVEEGNSFKVALEGGYVKYLKNGAVFYEHSTTPSYPLRGKVWLYTPNTKLDELLFTSSSSGLGEFNSGITVRGERIEDIVKLSTTALRFDNRYKGNDISIPSNVVSSIKYDNYYVSWEDALCFISIVVNINDYKINNFKSFDSVKHVRVRIYNRFGELVKQVESPFHGRGVAFSGFYKRAHADGKQEAVFSFEFENLYGYSAPIWYSEAGWLDGTADTWIEAPQNANISYSAPIWYNKNDVPTNVVGTTLTSTSIQLTWTKAVNGSAWNYQVYYRIFKPDGYEGDASYGGWTSVSPTTTDTFKTITGLQANTRYELMVQGEGTAYGWSEIVNARTYLIIPITTGFGTPSGLSGSALSSTQVALTWVKNDTANYIETEIWRTSAAAGTIPAVPDATSTQVSSGLTGTTYTNTGLTQNTAYSYRLRNKYTGPSYSDWSGVITVTTPLTSPPTPPSGVTAIALGYYSLRVSFYGNNGSVDYKVQVAYDGDYGFTAPVYDVASSGVNGFNSRTVNGLSSGTDYIIRVAKDGTSDWSLTAYGTTSTYGGEGGYCILETEPITYVSPTNDIFEIPVNTVKVGQMVLGTIAGRREVQPAVVNKVTPHVINGLLRITTKTGASVKCSLAHKPITNWSDTTGTKAEFLQEGDTVLVYDKMNNVPILDIIESIEYIAGEFTVIELSLDSEEHTYIGGGIFAHNIKEY